MYAQRAELIAATSTLSSSSYCDVLSSGSGNDGAVNVTGARLLAGKNCPGALPGKASSHVSSVNTSGGPGRVSSNPKRGSPGRCLITKNQPGSSFGFCPVPPSASGIVRSNPKK